MPFDAGSISSSLTMDVSPFRQATVEAGALANVFGGTLTNFIASPLLGIIGLAKEAGGALVGAFSSAISSGLKLAADAEQAGLAFEVMLRSADKAKATLAALTKFAADTPFQMPEVVATGRQLVNLGYEGDRMMSTLKAIGDVAAGTQTPLSQLGLVFGQVMNKTKLSGEELAQFNERSVPLRRVLEQMTGTTGKAFDDLVSKGGVSARQVEEAFKRMSGAGGSFENMMQRQSRTLAGLTSTMQDQWDAVKKSLGGGFSEGVGLKGIIDQTTGQLGQFEGLAAQFGTSIGSALKGPVDAAMRWVAEHPAEVKQKVQGMADGVVTAFKQIVDISKAALTAGTFLLDHWKEIAAGAAVLKAISMVENLSTAFKGLAASAALAKGASSGAFASAAGLAGGLISAEGAANRGAGPNESIGATIGGGLGGWGGMRAGAAIGSAILPGWGTVLGGIIGGSVGYIGGTYVGQNEGRRRDGANLAAEVAGQPRTIVTVEVKAGDTPDQIAAKTAQLTGNQMRDYLNKQEAARRNQATAGSL